MREAITCDRLTVLDHSHAVNVLQVFVEVLRMCLWVIGFACGLLLSWNSAVDITEKLLIFRILLHGTKRDLLECGWMRRNLMLAIRGDRTYE